MAKVIMACDAPELALLKAGATRFGDLKVAIQRVPRVGGTSVTHGLATRCIVTAIAKERSLIFSSCTTLRSAGWQTALIQETKPGDRDMLTVAITSGG